VLRTSNPPTFFILGFSFCYDFHNLLTFQCRREGFVQRLRDEQGEGCNIHGFVDVNKVAGNFHFAPGKSFDLSFNFLQDLLNIQPETYNASKFTFFLFLLKHLQYCA
jgi:hypothetical protein